MATFIAGPCVIESMELLETVAQELVRINEKLGTQIIFKASFDKANRTSIHSFRGPGLEKGLQMLGDIRKKYNLQVTTDIHESYQASAAGEVCDILQIPAFLCRQTDLLVSAAKTGKTVNIKKAQFLSGRDMKYPVEKALESGAKEVWLTAPSTCVATPLAALEVTPKNRFVITFTPCVNSTCALQPTNDHPANPNISFSSSISQWK